MFSGWLEKRHMVQQFRRARGASGKSSGSQIGSLPDVANYLAVGPFGAANGNGVRVP